jgi:hypothetical protein
MCTDNMSHSSGSMRSSSDSRDGRLGTNYNYDVILSSSRCCDSIQPTSCAQALLPAVHRHRAADVWAAEVSARRLLEQLVQRGRPGQGAQPPMAQRIRLDVHLGSDHRCCSGWGWGEWGCLAMLAHMRACVGHVPHQ